MTPSYGSTSRSLNGVRMEELTREYRRARAQVDNLRQRDLRRGFTYALVLLSAGIWILAAGRAWPTWPTASAGPIQELTDGLLQLAEGPAPDPAPAPNRRMRSAGPSGLSTTTAEQLPAQPGPSGLPYPRSPAGRLWARKMAHELKNSLT